jgi:hypothetical protein
VANMAKFSSDRAIGDYAKNIWYVNPKKADAETKTKKTAKVKPIAKVTKSNKVV